jgi:hypothetical protein
MVTQNKAYDLTKTHSIKKSNKIVNINKKLMSVEKEQAKSFKLNFE